MSQYILQDYLTDKNGNVSMMNFIDIKDNITTDDYYPVVLSDNYKYRLDLLAGDYLGNKSLYFLIMILNDISTLNDIEPGSTINLPTTKFITKYYNLLKKEVLQ